MVVVVVERRRVRSVRRSESGDGGDGGCFWRERRIIRDISIRVLTGFYTSNTFTPRLGF